MNGTIRRRQAEGIAEGEQAGAAAWQTKNELPEDWEEVTALRRR